MKIFTPETLEELETMYRAITDGEMVLHHIPGRIINPHAPACFRRADSHAYLMSSDKGVLEEEARSAGVKRIRIDQKNRRAIGIYYVTYLCGIPLEKLLKQKAARVRSSRTYRHCGRRVIG